MAELQRLVAARAAAEEGVRALFRGITPTLLGSFPYEGIKFGTYASLKRSAGGEGRRC